jgi:hypothetical protein
MKILKGFALAILGFLLFISLSVFGLAFTVKQTVLNPNFLAAEINKIPLTSLVQNSMNSGNLPSEVQTSLEKTITAMEPQLKQETSDAVKSLYDYFLGKKSNPELATTLRNTILSDTFVNSLIDNVDLATLLASTIHDQLNTQGIPRELLPLLDQIKPVLTKDEPQLKTQLKAAIPPVLDYIIGKTNSFKVTFTLDAVVNDLETAAKTIIKNNPSFAGASDAQLNSYIAQNLDPQLKDIASGLTLDQTTIGTDIPNSIAEMEQTLKGGIPIYSGGYVVGAINRHSIILFQQYYIWLIVLMVLLAAGIAAIHRSVRGATRSLGSIFLSYGIIEFVPLLAFRLLAPKYIFPTMMADIPSELTAFAQQGIFDFMSPLWWFSMGTLIAGIVLFVVSFVYQSRGGRINRVEICFNARLPDSYTESKAVEDLVKQFDLAKSFTKHVDISTSYGAIPGITESLNAGKNTTELEHFVIARAVILGMTDKETLFRPFISAGIPGVLIAGYIKSKGKK